MPPKAKITKEMILNTALAITQETGFEAVNARSIAGRLQCSTRPIFTCYENMEELKRDFLVFAYEYYNQYVITFSHSANVRPYFIHPISYLEFAGKETHLFKLLFISDMDLNMTEAKDFYNETDNIKRAAVFSESIGVEPERGRAIFLDLFLYTHGIAVLTATRKFAFDRNNAEKMLMNVLSALIRQENPGWVPDI